MDTEEDDTEYTKMGSRQITATASLLLLGVCFALSLSIASVLMLDANPHNRGCLFWLQSNICIYITVYIIYRTANFDPLTHGSSWIGLNWAWTIPFFKAPRSFNCQLDLRTLPTTKVLGGKFTQLYETVHGEGRKLWKYRSWQYLSLFKTPSPTSPSKFVLCGSTLISGT